MKSKGIKAEQTEGTVPCDKLFVDISVQYEVQVALSVSRLLVLEAKVKVSQHVQARSQQDHHLWNNTQFPFLSLSCGD